MFDEEQGKDVWYKGIVTEVLDDDEFDVYEGCENAYTVKLVEEHIISVVIEGKVDEPAFKKSK